MNEARSTASATGTAGGTGARAQQAAKAARIDAVAAAAAARSGDSAAVAAFARAFYAKVPADDLMREEVDSLVLAALSMWAWLGQRRPGEPAVRAFNPWSEPGTAATGGAPGTAWSRRDTVVEIVNDDMPFLVASVTAALNKRGAAVRLVIHPILRVRRDSAGRLLAAGEPGGRTEAGSVVESVMQLRIAGQPTPEALDAVAATVRAVLADVRAAVEDWGAMRARARAVVDELEGEDIDLPAADKADAAALLQWIADDHFTFLGYREYAYGDQGGVPTLDVDAKAGLGLLRDPSVAVFDGLRNFAALPPEVREFLRQPKLLLITKANRVSTVHRQAPLDALFLKRFDPQGRILGERVFVGLFTSSAYSQSATEIPVLSRKINAVLRRAGAAPDSHDGKALVHILETYPRDELLQVDEDTLLESAAGILDLQQRPRIALFVRRDPFARFMSCLVYIPLDLYSAELRGRLVKLLEDGFGGACSTMSVRLGDEALARLHATIAIAPGSAQAADIGALEARLVEAGRSWLDGLRDTLEARFGAERGDVLFRRYGQALPGSYREANPAARAADDIAGLETVRETRALAVRLRAPDMGDKQPGAKRLDLAVAAPDEPLPLFAILPVLEHMGLKVIGEDPTILQARRQPGEKDFPEEHARFSIQHFAVELAEGGAPGVAKASAAFEDAVVRVWRGQMEDDGFNALVLRAGLDWRDVTLLRAVAKYLRQAAIPFPQETMERALLRNVDVTRALVSLFHARFDPAGGSGRDKAVAESRRLCGQALEQVAAADDDRILRRYLNVLEAMTRTNFHQRQDGGPKPHLSFKLDSAALDDLPKPRPWREIFVYAPSVEGVHLRGGRVARGGLRWSDRREDFRTEVLGLMKAQMVKNAVIVPVGSKGGFVVKRPPPASAGRDAALAEGVACYRTFLRGLLDLTDNRVGDRVVPPRDVVRHDDDDPYLVVAADKGTATFSDIANGVAAEFGFWLDDAFASGGSAGYDHKKMGITAKGAWESVKRHFRELGRDIQGEDFSVAGVGDMSGDVFGNGMLLSRHIKLVAAFNHMHVFIDPSPDPAASWAERKRLFDLPRSQWSDYDPALISQGGGVFERKAKSVALTPQIRALLGIEGERIEPNALVKSILRAPVDLLYLGGIGTYVKARPESHADVGDRANDAVRVDGAELRAKVVGEGANLGLTQRGRVEIALAGGRLNTDFIDNSAGVDCSDHEVNIKILLSALLRPAGSGPGGGAGGISRPQRDALMAAMTDEVGELVLQDNYRQSLAITMMEVQAADSLDAHVRFMRRLERSGRLDRAVEQLPDDEEVKSRLAARKGLTRPELAVLLSYSKMDLYDSLLESDLPDDPLLVDDLVRYFPGPLRKDYRDAIRAHRLRREIIATTVTNSMVNRVGCSFVAEMEERSGQPAAAVARAYAVVRDVFGLRQLWAAIEALDGKAPAALQHAMLRETQRLIDRAVIWFLRHCPQPLNVSETQQAFAPGVAQLSERIAEMISAENRAVVGARAAGYARQGAPLDLATRAAQLTQLSPAMEIVRLAQSGRRDVIEAGQTYLGLGERAGFDWLRKMALAMPRDTHWREMAAQAIVEDLVATQAELAQRLLRRGAGARGVADWLAAGGAETAHAMALVDEMRRQESAMDFAMLAVANRAMRGLLAAT